MVRRTESVVAILAALAVCVVLITPAPDELPTVLPHTAHFNLAVAFVGIVALPHVLSVSHPAAIFNPQQWRSADLLSLMCSRLC